MAGYNVSGSFDRAQPYFASERGAHSLTEILVGEHETFEAALKRFNKKVQQDGILAEFRRREHYEKPSVRRKKKEAAKRRKAAKG